MHLSDGIIQLRRQSVEEGGPYTHQAVIMGDSRILGVDAKYLSDIISQNIGSEFVIHNYAIPNHGIRTYYMFLKKYLRRHQAPRFIILSSAPIGITGEWSIQEIDTSEASVSYLSRLYSIKDILEAFPAAMAMQFIGIKVEGMSKLISYRARLRDRILEPATLFHNRMSAVKKAEREYSGGQFVESNIPITSDYISETKYYDYQFSVDAESVEWYQKFFELAKTSNIQVLILNVPVVSTLYQKREENTSHKIYRDTVSRWLEDYDNLIVLEPLLEAYEIEYFSDWHHLNREGMDRFTSEIARRLLDFVKASE